LVNVSQSTSNDHYVEEKTEVLYDQNEIVRRVVERCYALKYSMDGCIDVNGPSMLVIPNHPVAKAFADMKNRGVRMRFISEIIKDNLAYCKELMKIGEVRHLDEVKGNFGVADGSVYHASATNIESGPPPQLIISTVKAVVKQQEYFFDMLWKKAIPAKQRIKEIEQGIKREFMDTIQDPYETQSILGNLLKSATKEIMLMIPTMKAFDKQHDIGILKLLYEAAMDRSVNIRILSQLKDFVQKERQQDQEIDDIQLPSPYVHLRNIGTSTTKSIILVVDRKESLVIEVKDNLGNSFSEAIGFATYSNSRSTVLSYVSIFESFWIQTEMYKKVKETEQMQKEFINIAAHELRNPIQPILSLTEVAERKTNDTQQKELLSVVVRNARKLKQLTEDVLDVTRIESDSLQLNKDDFSLNDLVTQVMQDYKNQTISDKKIKLIYDGELDSSKDHTRIIQADKYRINQVISNLVSNSVKFTKETGTISIKTNNDDDNKTITVSVKDTGTGIDAEILPRLFTKVSTKSNAGTGLGLFISKSIVEAHGGKIWAKNNADGKGATFYFSLPLSRHNC
jgi:two-component system sensor histidine kinase VicK